VLEYMWAIEYLLSIYHVQCTGLGARNAMISKYSCHNGTISWGKLGKAEKYGSHTEISLQLDQGYMLLQCL
jgi:hypothetical protein